MKHHPRVRRTLPEKVFYHAGAVGGEAVYPRLGMSSKGLSVKPSV